MGYRKRVVYSSFKFPNIFVSTVVTLLNGDLLILQEENLSAMNTDPWYSAYHYSHPPLVERLAALDEPDKKADWIDILTDDHQQDEIHHLLIHWELESWRSAAALYLNPFWTYGGHSDFTHYSRMDPHRIVETR